MSTPSEHQNTSDERAADRIRRAHSLLSKDSYEALDAAAQRLWGTSFEACIRRAVAAPWRPSTNLPDGACIRVALDLLEVEAIGRAEPVPC